MKPDAKRKSKPKPKGKPTNGLCEKCGQDHPRCKAHKKRKSKDDPFEPCLRYPCKNNKSGVCRNHGGESLRGIAAPSFKDGKRSKYMYLQSAELQERVQTLAKDSLKNLEESIQLAAMIESRALERFGSTESTEAWRKLGVAVNAYRSASDEVEQAEAFAVIALIVEEGLGEAKLVSDIFRAQEHQRKLSETVGKIKLQNAQALTVENWEWQLSLTLSIIRRNIADRPTLANLQRDFQEAFGAHTEQPALSS